MEHSIAFVAGAASGPGHAAARLLAAEGVEATQAPLSGCLQLTVGLLHSTVINNSNKG